MSTKKQLEQHKNVLLGYCLEEIELKLKESGCYNIEHYKTNTEYVFRCSKPDVHRKNFWDTWWFRLTSSGKKWTPEKIGKIKEHTICIDGRFRLEAYPPGE